jgi:hypothetical protein
MRIGILHEGSLDKRALTILIERVLNLKQIEFRYISAEGKIHARIEAAVTNFFDEGSDMVVLAGDDDPKSKSYTNLNAKIRRLKDKGMYKIALACPQPHFETWFIEEGNALKNLLGLSSTDAIPHENSTPKERVKKLFDNADFDIEYLLDDFYADLCKKMSLTTLRGDKRFQRFYDDLNSCKCTE